MGGRFWLVKAVARVTGASVGQFNTFSMTPEISLPSSMMEDTGMSGAAQIDESMGSVLVPAVLFNYLAARGSDPTHVLRLLVAMMGSGASVPLSPAADSHFDLAVCPWEATTAVRIVDGSVEATLAARDWTISAREDATEFTYTFIPEIAIGLTGKPLLRVAEMAIIPPELIIEHVEISPSGQGTFFCQGFMRPLDSGPNRLSDSLSDVRGPVSRSHRPR